MNKKVPLLLTISELNHILTLIQVNKDEGWYFGNKLLYWSISDDIKNKILKAKTCNNNNPEVMCPDCNCWKATRKICS